MTEKLQLTKSDRKKFGGVQPSYKGLGTLNGCKTWAGLIHSFQLSKTLY